MVNIKKFGIGLQPEIDESKALVVVSTMHEEIVEAIASLLKAHTWDLSNLSLKALKIFSSSDKYTPDPKINLEELPYILAIIDELGLKDLFNVNLEIRILNMLFVNKVKNYLDQGLAITDERGRFVNSLFSKEPFRQRATQLENVVTNNGVNINQRHVGNTQSSSNEEMNSEEISIYMSIRQKLQEICQIHPENENVQYLANNILAQVIERIKSQEYKFVGIRSMIENCMYEGLNMVTPEMEYDGEQFILAAFPDEELRRAL